MVPLCVQTVQSGQVDRNQIADLPCRFLTWSRPVFELPHWRCKSISNQQNALRGGSTRGTRRPRRQRRVEGLALLVEGLVGVVWCGLVWFGVVWFGLVWFRVFEACFILLVGFGLL